MKYNLVKFTRGAQTRNLADLMSDSDFTLVTFSDLADYFNPFLNHKTYQKVDRKDDFVSIDVREFLVQLAKGSPEFVELLFVRPEHAEWEYKNPFSNVRDSLLNKRLATSYLRSAKGLVLRNEPTTVANNKNVVDAYRRVLMAAQTMQVMDGKLPAKLWTPWLDENLAKTLREVRRSSFNDNGYEKLVLTELDKLNLQLEQYNDVREGYEDWLQADVYYFLYD